MQPTYDDYTIRLYMTNAELMKVKAHRDELLLACEAAKEALRSLQMDALGFAVSSDGQFEWPIRDELINDLTAAIAGDQSEKEIEL